MLDDSTLRSQEGVNGCVQLAPALTWLFPMMPSTVCWLDGSPKILGRQADCTIRLNSKSVSRRHAEIYRQGPIAAIKDLGSTNGVYVEGRRVAHAALKPGELVRIGDFLALYAMVPRDHPESPAAHTKTGQGLLAGPSFRETLRAVQRASTETLPIVIEGETGTGKELVARSIHEWSGRSGAFVAVNCAALPESMIESELFGYRQGAFTGAARSHLGYLRAAHRGTLFLDEILELPMVAQAKLLRAIERGEVAPLGEYSADSVDFRVVCASQGSLRAAVERGAFRADLYARLNGYTCSLPPLRSRRLDIPALFADFLQRFSGNRPPCVEVKLVERLCLHTWPNNVRELELLTRSLLALHGEADTLRCGFLPEHLRPKIDEEAGAAPISIGRDEHDLGRLVEELRRTGSNVARAAARAGFSRQRAYRLMKGSSASELVESMATSSGPQERLRGSRRN